jgi:hypothetical protein
MSLPIGDLYPFRVGASTVTATKENSNPALDSGLHRAGCHSHEARSVARWTRAEGTNLAPLLYGGAFCCMRQRRGGPRKSACRRRAR